MPATDRTESPIAHDARRQTTMRARLVALAVVLALGAASVAGIVALGHRIAGGVSSDGAATTTGEVAADGAGELRISREFGATTLLAKRLDIPASATAMSLLQANATVETAYGGGFVNAIDGVVSGSAKGVSEDWFYYVNGVQADRGASDYELSGADREWWDYHRWEFAVSVPAVVGQYPQPFLSGIGEPLPTVVAYADGASDAAATVARGLEDHGVTQVSVAPLRNDDPLQPGSHTIVVGSWDEISGLAALSDAIEAPGTSGLFARFDAGRLVTLDQLGAPTVHDGPAGVVLATAHPHDTDAVLWVVSGADETDVLRAATLFGDESGELAGRFGVAVMPDGSAAGVPTGDVR